MLVRAQISKKDFKRDFMIALLFNVKGLWLKWDAYWIGDSEVTKVYSIFEKDCIFLLIQLN